MTRVTAVGVVKPEAIKQEREIESRLVSERIMPIMKTARQWDMRTITAFYGDTKRSLAVSRAYRDAGLLGERCSPMVLKGVDARDRVAALAGPYSAREYEKQVHARTLTGEFGMPSGDDNIQEVDGQNYRVSFNGFEVLIDDTGIERASAEFFPRPLVRRR